ncbi:MAG: hypothetical protein V1843_03780, partial [bacterium]
DYRSKLESSTPTGIPAQYAEKFDTHIIKRLQICHDKITYIEDVLKRVLSSGAPITRSDRAALESDMVSIRQEVASVVTVLNSWLEDDEAVFLNIFTLNGTPLLEVGLDGKLLKITAQNETASAMEWQYANCKGNGWLGDRIYGFLSTVAEVEAYLKDDSDGTNTTSAASNTTAAANTSQTDPSSTDTGAAAETGPNVEGLDTATADQLTDIHEAGQLDRNEKLLAIIREELGEVSRDVTKASAIGGHQDSSTVSQAYSSNRAKYLGYIRELKGMIEATPDDARLIGALVSCYEGVRMVSSTQEGTNLYLNDAIPFINKVLTKHPDSMEAKIAKLTFYAGLVSIYGSTNVEKAKEYFATVRRLAKSLIAECGTDLGGVTGRGQEEVKEQMVQIFFKFISSVQVLGARGDLADVSTAIQWFNRMIGDPYMNGYANTNYFSTSYTQDQMRRNLELVKENIGSEQAAERRVQQGNSSISPGNNTGAATGVNSGLLTQAKSDLDKLKKDIAKLNTWISNNSISRDGRKAKAALYGSGRSARSPQPNSIQWYYNQAAGYISSSQPQLALQYIGLARTEINKHLRR